ncbi:MAG TPA: M55 family metallopeptidase [bacterium]|nr:M55 family metallopeptidase [bacterium]
MKIFIMTDLEGVAGVITYEGWANGNARYFQQSRTLLAMEVNAAVDGFISAGATDIVVADGHGGNGFGGVDFLSLDKRVRFQRGWPRGPYPLGLDRSIDAVAVVGQHAKAGTEYAHIAHTQSFKLLDLSINGLSIGEFGQVTLCAGELDIPVIFGSGDRAFCKEAAELVPGIETVVVKEGMTSGSGEECTAEEYGTRNNAAVHLHPEVARQLIREGAGKALNRFRKEKFGVVKLQPPYELVYTFRADGTNPQKKMVKTHPDSIIGVFNRIYEKERK